MNMLKITLDLKMKFIKSNHFANPWPVGTRLLSLIFLSKSI